VLKARLFPLTFNDSGYRHGPAAKPNASLEKQHTQRCLCLLSGADGWMFDGEDALGQINSIPFDNQRNLSLRPQQILFMKVARARWPGEMNRWSKDFFGYDIVRDWKRQLNFTTKLFRPASSPRRSSYP